MKIKRERAKHEDNNCVRQPNPFNSMHPHVEPQLSMHKGETSVPQQIQSTKAHMLSSTQMLCQYVQNNDQSKQHRTHEGQQYRNNALGWAASENEAPTVQV